MKIKQMMEQPQLGLLNARVRDDTYTLAEAAANEKIGPLKNLFALVPSHYTRWSEMEIAAGQR